MKVLKGVGHAVCGVGCISGAGLLMLFFGREKSLVVQTWAAALVAGGVFMGKEAVTALLPEEKSEF